MKKNEKEIALGQHKYKDKKSRIYYFDYLRIFCCFFVILIHISAEYYTKFNLNTYNWKIAYYYNGISRFSVPNFFMISGALFLNRDIPLKKIFNKYIKNLFIHLILWSMIYSLININLSKLNIKKKLFEIIKGHYHLWYLFATIGLYIIIPFSREIAKNEQLLKYFMFLYFIILFIIPNYIYLLSYYSKETYQLLIYVNRIFNLKTLSVNNYYFITGYYLNTKKIKKKFRIIIYMAGIFSLIFTTTISYNFAFIKKRKLNHFNFIYLNIFLTSISIFLIFKNIKFNTIMNNIIQNISKLTFGIYLIHPLIIENIIKKLDLLYLKINIILLIPNINIFVFLLSLIICFIINNIPIFRYYLI